MEVLVLSVEFFSPVKFSVDITEHKKRMQNGFGEESLGNIFPGQLELNALL